MKKLASLIIVLVFNLWLWRIFTFNILIGLLVLVTSLLLFLVFEGKKKLLKPFFILFLVVLLFQWKTTDVQDLTYLDNDQQRLQQQRLKEYPPVYLKVGSKTLWLPLAHWFEGRKESIAFFRISNNFFETIDPNLYFFANHPRARIGIQEFEKFPYLFYPFFFYGVFLLVKRKDFKLISLSFLIPLALISLIGHKNPIGPFALFPFTASSLAVGISDLYKKTVLKNKHKKSILVISFVVLLLVFLQNISYAIN